MTLRFNKEEEEKRKMTVTHPNFANLFPEMDYAEMWNHRMASIISQTNSLVILIPPCEKHLWKEDEVITFNVDSEKIENLYCFYLTSDGDDYFHHVAVGRMNYKNKKCVYFEIYLEYFRWSSVKAFMFACLDPALFVKIIPSSKYAVRRSLIQDGSGVDDDDDNQLRLQRLCYETLYQRSIPLHQLPTTLCEDVDKYILVRETQEAYKRCKTEVGIKYII